MTALIGILLFVALSFGMGWLAVRWLASRGRVEYQQEAEKLNLLSSLPIESAAAEARKLLFDQRIFRVVESPAQREDLLDSLAPEVRALLQQYESIELLRGPGARVCRSTIGPSDHSQGMVRIGDVGAGMDVAGEITVRPGEETVYESYPGEPPDPTFGTYKSIHHWLIAMAQE